MDWIWLLRFDFLCYVILQMSGDKRVRLINSTSESRLDIGLGRRGGTAAKRGGSRGRGKKGRGKAILSTLGHEGDAAGTQGVRPSIRPSWADHRILSANLLNF